jgi:hypothetical protein
MVISHLRQDNDRRFTPAAVGRQGVHRIDEFLEVHGIEMEFRVLLKLLLVHSSDGAEACRDIVLNSATMTRSVPYEIFVCAV